MGSKYWNAIGSLASLYFFISAMRARESIIYLSIIIALSNNLWNSWKQHQFYKRWERRIGVLLHEEDELLGDEVKQ